VATVYLRGHAGEFVCDSAELDGGLLTVSGRWWYTSVPVGWGKGGTFAWPSRRIEEIRWTNGRDAA